MMTRIRRRLRALRGARLMAIAAGLMLLTPGHAQDGLITPNYREADIRQVIDAVQAVTGRSMIVDQRVNAKVTLLSSEPMSAEEFYAAFLSLLQVNNFQAVETGKITRIIPNAQLRSEAANIGRAAPDETVTTVIRIENVSAAQLVPVLRPLLPNYAHLAAYQSSNTLIISDTQRNIDRIKYLLRQIDRPVEEDVEIVRLQNASAADLVSTISALTNASRAEAAAAGMSTNLVADARTNSILISGVASARLKIRTLIAHLDTPQEDGGDTQVRFLRYANAEDLATKLQNQSQNTSSGQPGSAAANGEVNIWADDITNALIITAPPATMRSIMAVIDKLDIRRAQVLVEALIVEVLIDNDSQLGVTWAVDGSNKDNAIGATDFSSAGGRVTGLAGAIGGDDASAIAQAIGEGLTLGVGRISDTGMSFAAILNALEGDATTNVISTPTLTTLDNEEARIEIGQEVPFVSGSFTNTGAGGAVNPFQTINREKVGTLLEITPQINEGTSILLKIKQEVSSLSQSAGAVDLITNERLIETSVMVEDGGILILGGLIDDSLRESDQRVPILGKLPLIGTLFRSRTTTKTKTNLMVFIKPRIIRDGVTARRETNAKYNFIRDLQQSNGSPVPLMPNADRPILPPYEEQNDEPAPVRTPENIMQESTGNE